MNILCISASNVRSRRETGTTMRVCELAKTMIQSIEPAVDVRVETLLDYALKPCEMCGACFSGGHCVSDEAWDPIFAALCETDGIVVVIPHYAMVPAKLVMILEKLQERAYYHYVTGTFDSFPLRGKPFALIGHGGMESSQADYYRHSLLDSVSNALKGIGMEAVGMNQTEPGGIVFGIQGMQAAADSILPEMVHDWDAIRLQMRPLLENLLQRVSKK